jgi:hypothetical protein
VYAIVWSAACTLALAANYLGAEMMVYLHETALRRYLLGDLSDVEREAVEREYFADAAIVDRLSEVEDDLIDDYLSDRLSEGERGSFEHHYLTVPRHRTRVAVANALRVTPSQMSLDARGYSRWSALSTTVRAWPTVAQVAFALALLLVATGGAWLIGWGSGRIVVSLLAPPGPPMSPTPLPDAAVTPPPAAAQPSIARSAPPVIVAVSVSPVHVRSAQDAATIVLKPGTDIVRLHLQGERGESPAVTLRAVVRSVAGEEIWRGSALTPSGSDPAAVAHIDVPAAHLRADVYIVQLLRTTARGQEVERYRYLVRVRTSTSR